MWLILACYVVPSVHSSYNRLAEEERAVCYALTAFLMTCGRQCYVFLFFVVLWDSMLLWHYHIILNYVLAVYSL